MPQIVIVPRQSRVVERGHSAVKSASSVSSKHDKADSLLRPDLLNTVLDAKAERGVSVPFPFKSADTHDPFCRLNDNHWSASKYNGITARDQLRVRVHTNDVSHRVW